jgi:hypothetical protein
LDYLHTSKKSCKAEQVCLEVTLQFKFGKCSVSISVGSSAILRGTFHVFHQSIQANMGQCRN